MNARLSMHEVAARIAVQLDDPTVNVGTAYERQFWKRAGSEFPGVWVGGQTLTPMDDGRGYTGLMRQHVRVEFGVRIVVQRAALGVNDSEAEFNALIDAVGNALLGWRPTGADDPLTWTRTNDEAPQETVLSAVLGFATSATYQKDTI